MILTAAAVSVMAAVGGASTFIADATTSGGTDPFTYLTGLGFPGIIIGLLLTGQLRTKAEVERLISENEHKDQIISVKDDQFKLLQESMVEKVIPALTRSTQILERIPGEAALLGQLQNAQQEIITLTSRIDQLRRDRD